MVSVKKYFRKIYSFQKQLIDLYVTIQVFFFMENTFLVLLIFLYYLSFVLY